jgi:hypothetical protein
MGEGLVSQNLHLPRREGGVLPVGRAFAGTGSHQNGENGSLPSRCCADLHIPGRLNRRTCGNLLQPIVRD